MTDASTKITDATDQLSIILLKQLTTNGGDLPIYSHKIPMVEICESGFYGHTHVSW
jgi:hypothetical protein